MTNDYYDIENYEINDRVYKKNIKNAPIEFVEYINYNSETNSGGDFDTDISNSCCFYEYYNIDLELRRNNKDLKIRSKK